MPGRITRCTRVHAADPYAQSARVPLITRHRRPRVFHPRHHSRIHTHLRAGQAPLDFQHISPIVSQANLSRLRQACQLDEEITPITVHDNEPPAPSARSASSFVQQEREFQKAVQPGSLISALLSSVRQPFMVAHAGVGATRGEPTLLRKLQATKKDVVKSPVKTHKATSRLQEIMEEGGAGGSTAYEK